jgi:diguanylate cyclase (GGDEF)-like protein/PAS domain S-box-containing protein
MDNVIRLIIIDDDLNDAEMMISAVKSIGFAVRARQAQNEADLIAALKDHAPDLVLHAGGTELIDLERTVHCIREVGKHVPVLAVAPDGTGDAVECMQRGADDLVSKENREHLKLVVSRTYKFQQQWRKLKTLEAAVNESEKRCRTLLDSSRDSICYVHEGMHIYANDTYLDLFGYTDMEDIEGMPLMDLIAPDQQHTLKNFLRKLNSTGTDNQTLDIKLKHAKGDYFDAQMEFSPASIDGESCTQIVIRNQANAKELEQQLNYLSQRDVATGLYNRKYFMGQLDLAIGRATQGTQNSAILQLDIGNMAEIKDLVGVAATDLVIADIAKILESQKWDSEVLARFGEGSFTILTDHHGNEALKARAKDLVEAINKHTCDVEGKSIVPQACVGAIPIDENTPETNELFLRMEKCVDQAAQLDADRIVIFVPKEGEMTQKQQDSLWASKLLEALQQNRFQLLFQPIASLHGDPGQRYEVFMRLRDEENQTVPTEEFMASAGRTGLTKSLDRWLIISAINSLAKVRKSEHDTSLFINLTEGSLQDPELLPWLAQQLRESRLPPANLVFETKEETLVTYLKQAKTLIKGLKDLHCKFAIDDFGTGLHPFQLVKALAPDYLKIDRSLMENISSNNENQEAVRTITDTAHASNLVTIAQFVDDAAALSVLWSMGVNYIQGDFLQEASEEMNFDFSALG